VEKPHITHSTAAKTYTKVQHALTFKTATMV